MDINAPAIGRFHSSDNLCFERRPDGGVTVLRVAAGHDALKVISPVEWFVDLTPEGWASVVASMSAAGETFATFDAALARQKAKAP